MGRDIEKYTGYWVLCSKLNNENGWFDKSMDQLITLSGINCEWVFVRVCLFFSGVLILSLGINSHFYNTNKKEKKKNSQKKLSPLKTY